MKRWTAIRSFENRYELLVQSDGLVLRMRNVGVRLHTVAVFSNPAELRKLAHALLDVVRGSPVHVALARSGVNGRGHLFEVWLWERLDGRGGLYGRNLGAPPMSLAMARAWANRAAEVHGVPFDDHWRR